MPSKYAVCIGINDYPGTGSDLEGCVNDARDWETELKNRKFSVTRLLDKEATRKAMLGALGDVIRKAVNEDLVVFTYSGHGSWQPDMDGDEEDGRDEGWCPCDINRNGLVLDDELYALFEAAAQGVRLVMISDSCHSGTVARVAPAPRAAGHIPRIRFLPPSVFLKSKTAVERSTRIARSVRRSSRMPRALLISGCHDFEYSYDARFNNRPNGALTHFALQTLKKMKATASYADWARAIRENLPSQVHPQTPQLDGAAAQKKWRVFE